MMIAETGALHLSPWIAGSPHYRDADYLKRYLVKDNLLFDTDRLHEDSSPSCIQRTADCVAAETYISAEDGSDAEEGEHNYQDADLAYSPFVNVLGHDIQIWPQQSSMSVLCQIPTLPSEVNDDTLQNATHALCGNSSQTQWSTLNSDEQEELVASLSRIISDNLDHCEQLEAMQILNSEVRVLPTQNRIVIEPSWMTDEKLAHIRDFVKHHTRSCCSSSSCSSIISDCSSTCSQEYLTQSKRAGKKSKRRTTTDRNSLQRVSKLKLRKEQRQALKERRSGLFGKEQILAISRHGSEIDEDIDVLG